jgi:hypothetical protein
MVRMSSLPPPPPKQYSAWRAFWIIIAVVLIALAFAVCSAAGNSL